MSKKRSKFKDKEVIVEITYRYSWDCGDGCCTNYDSDIDTFRMRRALATHLVRRLMRKDVINAHPCYGDLRSDVAEEIQKGLSDDDTLSEIYSARII